MDYFFAQVEELDNPKLTNLPVAIGSRTHTRGVLCTANYVARKFGVKSAMPTAKALKLCPDLVLIPPHFEKYKKASESIFKVFKSFTNKIEGISLDEAYLDVTDCKKFNNDAIAITQEIRRRIYGKTGLTCSAGISYNKLLSKIASDLNKPNGISVIRPHGVIDNISHFSISKLWGVGKVTQKKMESFGLKTFGDIQKYKKIELITMFGDQGVTFYDFCRGIDNREVQSRTERKSVSVEHTFLEDIHLKKEIYEKINYCFEELSDRLEKYDHREIKNIHLKIKFNDFTQTTVEAPMLSDHIQLDKFIELVDKRIDAPRSFKPIRLIGIGVKFINSKEIEGQMEMKL